MPRRVRRARRRNPRAPRRVRGGRLAKAKAQTCFIKETIQFVDFLPNESYYNGFNLAQFARAAAIAPNFRWYKATRCEWSYEPIYNTYQVGLAATPVSPGVPYFYSARNPTQDAHQYTLNDIQAQGSKPRKFTSRIKISYVPNWCSGGLTIQGQVNNSVVGIRHMGLKAEKSWLECPNTPTVVNGSSPNLVVIPSTIDGNSFNPQTGLTPQTTQIMADQVMYNGHDIFIDQANGINTNRVCRCTVTVHWAFKGPNNYDNQAVSRKMLEPLVVQP